MIFARILLFVSVAALALAFLMPEARDLILLAGPGLLAALLLLWRGRRPAHPPRPAISFVVDGSNVLFWNANAPQLETVRAVVDRLTAYGQGVCVIFDANVGYKIADRYLDDAPLAKALGLPSDRVWVMPRGEPADPAILKLARHTGARVVSNDRFRDWHTQFPEAASQRFALRGGYRKGQLWLEDAEGRQSAPVLSPSSAG